VIEIEAAAQALQDQVSEIMLAIMANLTASLDTTDEASKIEIYVASLRRQAFAFSQDGPIVTPVLSNRRLEIIYEEVSQIRGKKKWLLAFSKGSVKLKIEE